MSINRISELLAIPQLVTTYFDLVHSTCVRVLSLKSFWASCFVFPSSKSFSLLWWSPPPLSSWIPFQSILEIHSSFLLEKWPSQINFLIFNVWETHLLDPHLYLVICDPVPPWNFQNSYIGILLFFVHCFHQPCQDCNSVCYR